MNLTVPRLYLYLFASALVIGKSDLNKDNPTGYGNASSPVVAVACLEQQQLVKKPLDKLNRTWRIKQPSVLDYFLSCAKKLQARSPKRC